MDLEPALLGGLPGLALLKVVDQARGGAAAMGGISPARSIGPRLEPGTVPDGRSAMRIRSKGFPVYLLMVTLRDSSPPTWRRFLVPGHVPLKRLHDVLQAVMGWTDSHCHRFEAGGVLYGTGGGREGPRMVSENRTKVADVLCRPEDRLTCEYDFGDGWEHDVVLDALLPAEPGGLYPVVEAGSRACPPEDVGGISGYGDFLDALAEGDRARPRG